MNEDIKSHLPHNRIRPRFKINTPYTVEQLSKKISTALEKTDCCCIGKSKTGYVTLFVPKKDQHYWSPQLNLTMEENETGCTLRGLYGPRPAVWTLFVFFYSIIGFAVLLIGMIGLSKISLGNSGKILWLVPLFILIISSLYLVAHFGQKLGEKQMIILHKFLENSTQLVIDSNEEI